MSTATGPRRDSSSTVERQPTPHQASGGGPIRVRLASAIARLTHEAPVIAAALSAADATHARALESAAGEHALTMRTLTTVRREAEARLTSQHAERVAAFGEEFDRADSAGSRSLEQARTDLRDRYRTESEQLAKRRDEATWFAETVLESDIARSKQQEQANGATIRSLRSRLDNVRQRAIELNLFHTPGEPTLTESAEASTGTFDDMVTRTELALARAEAGLDRVAHHWTHRASGTSSLITMIVLGAALGGGAGWLSARQGVGSPAVSIGAGVVLGAAIALGVWALVRSARRRQAASQQQEINSAFASALGLVSSTMRIAAQQSESRIAAARLKRREAVERAASEFAALMTKLQDSLSSRLSSLQRDGSRQQSDRVAQRHLGCQTADAELQASLAQVRDEFERDRTAADEALERATRTADDARASASASQRAVVASLTAEVRSALGAADAAGGGDRSGDDRLWPLVLGRAHLDLTASLAPLAPLAGAHQLVLDLPARAEFPICLELPSHGHLLFLTEPSARQHGAAHLATVALDLLTHLPAGKTRLTLIDPIGLGQSFAGFMRLADEGRSGAMIVGERVWTDARQIEQRLGEVTEHIETVIQKYLQDRYATIDEYNRVAGEVAEAYRIIVFADLPTNLSDVAARRLASIITSGPRCGVYVLASAPLTAALPSSSSLTLDDLRRASLTIRLQTDGTDAVAKWDCPTLGAASLSVHPPIGGDELGRRVLAIGREAAASMRVAVPFRAILPREGEAWSRSSAEGLSIPLGRAGATRVRQLELGQGTAQHVLIAGRTGSGKSTLLNVLISAGAWWYSPGELEFYLVDFKKGVEFKAYARRRLPHARVVAIESEREFGVSVLRRLDHELTRRGELFRAAGVQGLAGYRAMQPSAQMPRIVLIVDEFQEFFVEDDKIAQEASLLLDRLVRQGRAFGVHVVLGSQTLAGAYSLARATMGQMGVRIALQCSEADSYLILADDNPAARLLTRPGEAIYNDASGMLAGNHPFQTAWLDEVERDAALVNIASHARQIGSDDLPDSPIVFEGGSAADPGDDPLVRSTLGPSASRTDGVPLIAGRSMAIDQGGVLSLRRQAGANVLLVGQDAPAISAAILLTMLAARRAGAQVRLVSAMTDGAAHAALARAATVAGVQIIGAADMPAMLSDIASIIDRRTTAPEQAAQPIVMIITGLERLATLQHREDAFDFSSDAPAATTPDVLLERIVRDGPSVGVHAILAADTGATVTRMLRRKALAACDIRLCTQMSVNDSSALVDSAAASRLGPNRMLLVSLAAQQSEKLRTFTLPSDELIANLPPYDQP
jgi:hypothetical protein